MAQYVRMVAATGEVESATARNDLPAGLPDDLAVKGWRWLEIIENTGLQVWQRQGGLPATVPTDATTVSREIEDVELSDWKAMRVAALRTEAGRRITAFAPQHLQNNILARAVEITRKRATAAELTPQDEADEAQCLAIWAQIDPIRSACNAAEAAVNAATDHAGVETAFAAVAWP